ncbi:MAG: phosphodiester glycosidase family protein [Pseudomonadota bacterium]
MKVNTRFFDRALRSGKTARVLRIDPGAVKLLPLFNERATPAEDRLAQTLGEARLNRGLVPVPPASVRLAQPKVQQIEGLGPVTCLAERSRHLPGERLLAAPLHLLRLAAARLALGELLINANHFLFLPPELTCPWDAYGDPIGLNLAGGVIETPPQARRACLLVTTTGPEIRRLGFADCSIKLTDERLVSPHPYGPPDKAGALTAFALFHGSEDGASPEASGVWDVAYVGRHAVALKAGGGMPIPRAGCVIRFASVDEAQAAQRITYRLGLDIQEGVQAGPVIVENGAPTDIGRDIFAEELMRPVPSRPDAVPISPYAWAANWHETRAARLSAGITADGALFFCAVEGTSSFFRDRAAASGATLHDLACLMAEEGAETAMHLDGGGSTQVFCAGGGALLTPRDVHHCLPESLAQFDRPLPLALRLSSPQAPRPARFAR